MLVLHFFFLILHILMLILLPLCQVSIVVNVKVVSVDNIIRNNHFYYYIFTISCQCLG